MEHPNQPDYEQSVANQMDQPSPKNMLWGLICALLTFLLAVICVLSIQIFKREAADFPQLPSQDQSDPDTPPLVDPDKQPAKDPATTDPTTPSDPVENPPEPESFLMKKTASTQTMDQRVGEMTTGIYSANAVLVDLADNTIVAESNGDKMIYPASMAVAIGEHLGLSHGEILRGVAAYVSTGSRMRRLRMKEERLVIDDCYNANPAAMQETLRILAKSKQRKLAILGDMAELGDLTPAAHRAVGELAAQLQLDEVVAIGPKSVDIAAGGGALVRHFLTIEEAMPTIHQLFTPGTTALVKASHSMGFEKIVKELEETYQ